MDIIQLKSDILELGKKNKKEDYEIDYIIAVVELAYELGRNIEKERAYKTYEQLRNLLK